MNLVVLNINNLLVSPHNVRKTLTYVNEEEGSISDLANDIKANGLLNPITVRKSQNGMYEVIAGQRRFLAFKHLSAFSSSHLDVPCNVIEVNDQKAEELSLVENVQRNQMSAADKVSAYSKLFNVYDGDLNKVASTVHVSKSTIKKYVVISSLPEEVISKMDSSNEDKITLDVAVELAKLPSNVDVNAICQNIEQLTSSQKIGAIKEFIREENTDADDIIEIAENIVLSNNNIKLAPAEPYVYDEETKEFLIIPKSLYKDIVKLIRTIEDS